MPAQINSSALNMAWITMWKKARLTMPRPIAAIIIPSCLKVDRAIIFFMSHSVIALRPAIVVVDTATSRRNWLNRASVLRNG